MFDVPGEPTNMSTIGLFADMDKDFAVIALTSIHYYKSHAKNFRS